MPSISLRTDAAALRGAIEDVDAIVLLHSTNGDTTDYLEPFASSPSAIVACRCFPSSATRSICRDRRSRPNGAYSARIRPDWIATQLLEEAGQFLFGDVVERVGGRYSACAQSECVPADTSHRPATDRHWNASVALLAPSRRR